jgi:nucleoside-diphosphate-sugar epimerase
MNVLVTGAGGFLGSHAVQALLAAGANVHGFVRTSSSLDRLAACNDRVEIHRGDVEDYASVLRCFCAASPEVVFHLAGDITARRSEGGWAAIERSIGINLVGTLNVIRAAEDSAAPVRAMVRAGGLEEYGTCATPFTERDREQPVSAYSASQVSATHFCQALQRQVEFAMVTVRPALVYGPGQALDFFIPQLIESCLAGVDFDMTEGTQKRDLVYIDDVVAGLLLAASHPGLRGAIINLGTGEEHALSVVADQIVRLTGASIQVRRGARRIGPSDMEHLVASTEYAAATLGWRSQTSLADGLQLTVAWHRAKHEAASRNGAVSAANHATE